MKQKNIRFIIQNFNGKKENVVYTEQSLGEALLTRGLIKKKDEEILQDCFARCCMGELRRAAQTDALTRVVECRRRKRAYTENTGRAKRRGNKRECDVPDGCG